MSIYRCKNLMLRSKKYIKYFYCKELNKKICLNDCQKCSYFKQNSIREHNYTQNKKSLSKGVKKPLRKVSKKRVFVSNETYQYVLSRDKKCMLCGSSQLLELHHINGRGKFKTNDVNNCIMLCNNCHHNKVHKNNKYFRPLLNKIVNETKKEP